MGARETGRAVTGKEKDPRARARLMGVGGKDLKVNEVWG